MKILIPQGIGDSIWALHKVQSLARGQDINIALNCLDPTADGQNRAQDFVKRFKFIQSCKMYICEILKHENYTSDGYYNYIPDGIPDSLPGIDWVMMPNAALERGIRLENWLPEYEINWNIMDDFQFTPQEIDLSEDFYNKLGKFAVFYMSNLSANFERGHNRNAIWKPSDWVELGNWLIKEKNLSILVVGASYDASYFTKMIDPYLTKPESDRWFNCIGEFPIPLTYAIIKKANFFLSYQSGIGIVSHYFGVPGGIFWRAKGDSLDPSRYISFEEDMSHCWTNPKYTDRFMPLIYGRHDIDYIKSEIILRNWV